MSLCCLSEFFNQHSNSCIFIHFTLPSCPKLATIICSSVRRLTIPFISYSRWAQVLMVEQGRTSSRPADALPKSIGFGEGWGGAYGVGVTGVSVGVGEGVSVGVGVKVGGTGVHVGGGVGVRLGRGVTVGVNVGTGVGGW
jgi:hypothetical protein